MSLAEELPPSPLSPEYQLRSGTPDDLEFAVELERVSVQPYLAELPGWSDEFGRDEMTRRWAVDPYQIIMVNAERTGILAVTERNGVRVLKHIAIVPEFQGKGIGTAAISGVIADATRDGLGMTLFVLVSNPALRLYKRLGFVVTERRDTGIHGVKYRMDRELEKC